MFKYSQTGNLLWSGYSFESTLSVLMGNLSLIAPGVLAFRGLVHIPFDSASTLVVDFVEVFPNSIQYCSDIFYVVHSQGKHMFNLIHVGIIELKGETLEDYPGNLTFGNSEPSWAYLDQPR